MLKRVTLLFTVCLLFALAVPVFAHASLLRSDPLPNATLDQAPAEIRLTFSEPLEPGYSRITLLNSLGERVSTSPASIDPADQHQLVLVPGELPTGVYTAAWQALSAADGHTTQGTLSFGVGTTPTAVAPSAAPEQVPLINSLARALHLLSFTLALGVPAFIVWIWRPVVETAPPRRLTVLAWVGWLLLGLSGPVMAAMMANASLDTLTLNGIIDFLRTTTFGELWFARMLLWVAMGAAVVLAKQEGWALAFFLGMGVLLSHTLYSHASAAQDRPAAIALDWLHVLATSIWLGGLIAMLMTLAGRRLDTIGRLTAQFSNMARICMIALIISGSYAAWLHVGSVEALTTTPYGRALLVKLVLFLPVLIIAALNLLLTTRRLLEGRAVWVGRLQALVAVEIVLALGILTLAGVLTSISPARTTVALREAVPVVIPAAPRMLMREEGEVMGHLTMDPATVGVNTLTLELYSNADHETGGPITDASLIRLRFENLDRNLGRSEERPTLNPDGLTYGVTTSALSQPGRWRIRATVQRPGEFDTVIDFETTLENAPVPVYPEPNLTIPLASRQLAAVMAGGLLLLAGAYFGASQRRWLPLAAALVGVGAACVAGLVV